MSSVRQLYTVNAPMADEHLRNLMENADDLVPVLYDHARKLAARKLGWHEGKTLPLGKTPEDIVTEVYLKYVQDRRHFDPTKDLLLQLKGSVRSLLSALGDKSSTSKERLAATEEDMAAALNIGSTDATPAEMVESADFAKAVVAGLKAHPRIKASPDLQDLLAALELDVTEVAGQARELQKNQEHIYQLRHQLRQVYLEVVNGLNKEREITI